MLKCIINPFMFLDKYATGASNMLPSPAMQMEISASGVRVPQQARSTLLFIFWQNFPNEIGEAVQD
jgi:hypothetical protein